MEPISKPIMQYKNNNCRTLNSKYTLNIRITNLRACVECEVVCVCVFTVLWDSACYEKIY